MPAYPDRASTLSYLPNLINEAADIKSILPNPRDDKTDYNKFKKYWQEKKKIDKDLDSEFTADTVKRFNYWYFRLHRTTQEKISDQELTQYKTYLSARKSNPLTLTDGDAYSFDELRRYGFWRHVNTTAKESFMEAPWIDSNSKDTYNKYETRLHGLQSKLLFGNFSPKDIIRFEYWYDIYNSDDMSKDKVVLDLEGKSTEPLDFPPF